MSKTNIPDTTLTDADKEHINTKKARKNSEKTTGSPQGDVASKDKYNGLFDGGTGALLKAGIMGYALSQTHHKHAYNKCEKRLRKVKKLEQHLNDAHRYASSAQTLSGTFSNAAGEAFERTMLELKQERIEKTAARHKKHIDRCKRLAQRFGNVMATTSMVARTSMMQRAIDSPSGSATGIERAKLAVGMGMFGDGVMRFTPHEAPESPDMESEV